MFVTKQIRRWKKKGGNTIVCNGVTVAKLYILLVGFLTVRILLSLPALEHWTSCFLPAFPVRYPLMNTRAVSNLEGGYASAVPRSCSPSCPGEVTFGRALFGRKLSAVLSSAGFRGSGSVVGAQPHPSSGSARSGVLAWTSGERSPMRPCWLDML